MNEKEMIKAVDKFNYDAFCELHEGILSMKHSSETAIFKYFKRFLKEQFKSSIIGSKEKT